MEEGRLFNGGIGSPDCFPCLGRGTLQQVRLLFYFFPESMWVAACDSAHSDRF